MADRGKTLAGITLLYVEDDETLRGQAARMLARRVGQLRVAADGQDGLYQFTRFRPDVVLTDIQMPIMDGLKMARSIKALDADTPIILTTAHNDREHILEAIDIGINRYLTKPFNTEKLFQTLEDVSQTLLARRELQRLHEREEEELNVTLHLLRRMMRAKGLKDERVRYWIQPAERFSGDMVAAARSRDGALFLFMADATGHGLPAAVHLLPLHRIFYAMVEKGFSLPSIVTEMNSVLKDFLPADRFVAATLARIDEANRIIEVWNGGNPEAWFVSCDGATTQAFPSIHPPLGIQDSKAFRPQAAYFAWQSPGVFYLASDGVLEARGGEDNKPYGSEGLLRAIAQTSPENRFEGVVESLRQHLEERPAHDDLSLLIAYCRND